MASGVTGYLASPLIASPVHNILVYSARVCKLYQGYIAPPPPPPHVSTEQIASLPRMGLGLGLGKIGIHYFLGYFVWGYKIYGDTKYPVTRGYT